MKKLNLILLMGFISFSILAQHNYDDQSVIYSDNGNVGIGTTSPTSPTSPTYPLSVRHDDGLGNASHNLASFTRLNSGPSNAGLSLQYEANGSSISRTLLYFPGGIGATFQVYNQGALDVLHLNPDGNVGIGTTSPTYPLSVRHDDGLGNASHNLVSFTRLNSGSSNAGLRACP